jgi:uncharacterized protein YggE
MFRTSLSAAIGLSLMLAAPVAVVAQSEAADEARTIIVSGTGQSSTEPDEAVIRIVEGGQRYPSYPLPSFGDTAAFAAEAAPQSTPIEPGLVDVSTTVTVEYEIG